MSSTQVFSLGIGIVLRLLINSLSSRNDKLAGALSGIWDGIVAYAAWRTDRLLEPTVLVEIIASICFDALYHVSTVRLVSLSLGTTLGVLLSDTAGLHTLWDDLGENVQVKLRNLPVDITDDLDSPEVLSEFSEDVTIIYEQHTSTTSPRTRKMTTAEWIAAQRKARAERSSKSTASRSMRASASSDMITTDLDKSLMSSDLDTQIHVTTRTIRTNPSVTQTQSSRARRDRELLATMTPLPPPTAPSSSNNPEIYIDILSPSVTTRLSSPTYKPEIIEEMSVRESNEGAIIDVSKDIQRVSSPPRSTASKSNRSTRKETAQIISEAAYAPADRPPSPSSTKTERAVLSEQQANPQVFPFSERSTHMTMKDTHVQTPNPKHSRTTSATDRSPFTPFIPPRPVDTREPTVMSASRESRKTSGHSPKVLSEDPSLDRVATGIFSNWNDELRTRPIRSRASTRPSPHLAEQVIEPSIARTQSQHTTVRSRSSTHLDGGLHEEESAEGYVRGERSFRHGEQQPVAPSTHAPEVIIDYSGNTTRIYIPPPAETGINVRVVPRAEETLVQEGIHDIDDEVQVDHGYLSENYHYSYQVPQPIHESAARSQEEIPFVPYSIGSFPDLETVPPVDEQGVHASIGEADGDDGHRSQHSRRSHASRAEQSSDLQPPSEFRLSKAWRDSAEPISSSSGMDYGRIIEQDDPLPIYISEDVGVGGEPSVGVGGPSEYLHVARSRAGSSSGRLHPISTARRSRSATTTSLYSQNADHDHSHNHRYQTHSQSRNEGSNSLNLDMRGVVEEMEKTPSVEWLGPAISRSQSVRDRSRGRSVGEASGSQQDKRRSGSIIPIARSQDPRQSSTFITSPTIDGNILSPYSQRTPSTHRTHTSTPFATNPTHINPPGTPNLRSRATELENQVAEVEARCRALRERIGEAEREGKKKLAFELGCELEDARERAEKLKRRAGRALNAAQEAEEGAERIDVHRLNALQAVHAVNNALQALQRRARSTIATPNPSPGQNTKSQSKSRSRSRIKNKLTVIVDHGQRTAEGSSVRRNYIIDKITRKYHFDVQTDETNPNVLHISIPSF